MTDRDALIARLRAYKTCDDEPKKCYLSSGPYCGEHQFNEDFVPLLREAADALSTPPPAPDQPCSERMWTTRELVESVQHALRTAGATWRCPYCEVQSPQTPPTSERKGWSPREDEGGEK